MLLTRLNPLLLYLQPSQISLAEATSLCFLLEITKPAKNFSVLSIKHVAWRVKKAKAHIAHKYALFSLYSLFIE
jgi:hypothetical protein